MQQTVFEKWLKFILLGLAALGLGLIIGLLSAGFLHIVDWGQWLLWESGWSEFPFAPLLICTTGGILVGLCQRYLGNHSQSIMEATQELRKTGRLAYNHLFQGLATVGTSLIFGASLGPEAAIMDLLGGLSTWAADCLRGLRARMHLELPSKKDTRLQHYAEKWPAILAISIAILTFGFGVRTLYGGSFLSMQEGFAWQDLFWSIPLGCIGAALGALYGWLTTITQKIMQPLQQNPIIRTTLTGAALGLAASFLPMMLFSGQHYLQSAYTQAAKLGALALLLIALLRMIMIALLLSSGWKGGQFLPLMFAGTAMGLSLSQALPFISAPAGILAVMAGLLVVVLPNALFALILMLCMFPLQYAGIFSIAVLIAALVKTKIYGVPLFVRKPAVSPIE